MKRDTRIPGRGTALALALGSLGAACGREPEPAAPAIDVRLVDLARLEVAVQQNLGRGALVALWATW